MNHTQLFGLGSVPEAAPEIPVKAAKLRPHVYAQHDSEEGVDIVQIIPGINKDDLRRIGGILANKHIKYLSDPGVTTFVVPEVDVNIVGFKANPGGLAKIATAVEAFVDSLP